MNQFATTVQELEEAEEATIMMVVHNGLRGTWFAVELIDHIGSRPSPRPSLEPRVQ